MSLAMRVLDGSTLEGGGQLLRNAAALSALTSRPMTIHNIRHNRTPPGLRNQHAAGLQLVAQMCQGQLEGAETGSSQITFTPGPMSQGDYLADPRTAGSTSLLLQVSLPCLLYSANPGQESSLTLRGGTNASQAPQVDYALSSVAGVLPRRIAEQMRQSATDVLVSGGVDPKVVDIKIQCVQETEEDAFGNGSGIVLWAETENGCRFGGSAVGAKGVDARKVGTAAGTELLRNLQHGGCVDEYLQDQIIVFLALAKGESVVKTGPLTLHTRTAIWVAEQMTEAQFNVDESDPEHVTIRCRGIGFSPRSVNPDDETNVPLPS